MKRILFLDIDGVLNPRWWENNKHDLYKQIQKKD